jgi:hypothetical protein
MQPRSANGQRALSGSICNNAEILIFHLIHVNFIFGLPEVISGVFNRMNWSFATILLLHLQGFSLNLELKLSSFVFT